VLNKTESCFTTDINQSIIPILDALYKLDTEKEEIFLQLIWMNKR